MSDFISAINPTEDFNTADVGGPASDGSSLNTGLMRRKFNFGNQVSELAITQDPFFRFVSKVSKSPTDDPSFKFTEKRPSWHKRYAYIAAAKDNSAAWVSTNDLGAVKAVGDTINLRYITDYKNSGNVTHIFGNSNSKVVLGSTGTMPQFFIADQVIKVPCAAAAAGANAGYMLVKVNTVTQYSAGGSYVEAGHATNNAKVTTTNNPDMVQIDGTVVRIPITSANSQYLSGTADLDQGLTDITSSEIASSLEGDRTYVVGTAHAEGTGYPETWKDQPYSTGFGYTQIWKTSMAMTNTARATVLKYEPNEWARVWKEKLIEHKWDIEQSLLFGSQVKRDDIQYTQGAVDFLLNYGNSFSLTIATKTADDFLDDMSNYLDPRYNNSKATVFFCNTAVYNWLHKLGGYFSNNLNTNSNFSADLAVTGRKKVLGLDTTTINTVYGDMNLVRNIHLDGTDVKMLGINMKHCKYRPLVGNGVNRDTSVYVGVQTLENSGVDRRVDLILTEAGMEWSMPESHAIWT